MSKIVDLFSSHDKVASLLNAHKRAVVLGLLPKARQSFHEFWVALNAHSMCEDELLLPKFVELGLESNGCTAEMLSKEHEKLRRLADEARARVNGPLVGLDADNRIELIEQLHMMSEVLEHHDVRERAAFLCKFEDVLNKAEIDALVDEAFELEKVLAERLGSCV
ncbi:MAG TPA: hypothetical protein EYN86_03320 [Planctomycetes bacterium]|nr:hypothetical protein [Planctomycetota bacterium]